MQNYEGVQSGGSGKTFGHNEEKRTVGSRLRNAFNKTSEDASNAWNGAGQNLSDEWQQHAKMARRAKGALVRFLEGALGTPPEDEDCYAI